MERFILAVRPEERGEAQGPARRYGLEVRTLSRGQLELPGLHLLHTAMSGGSLRERLGEAVGRYGQEGVAVWLDRSAEDFPLPAPTGSGRPLTRAQLAELRERQGGAVFFSPHLCARYFTYLAGEEGRLVLFDDPDTLREKAKLARRAGIATLILSWAEGGDCLGEILG